jgi:hypothetical protein
MPVRPEQGTKEQLRWLRAGLTMLHGTPFNRTYLHSPRKTTQHRRWGVPGITR